jgi:hypothetical protein
MEDVKISAMFGTDYVQTLQERLRVKTVECDRLKKELLDLTSHHADLYRSYCKDYKIAIKNNRKLKKRLLKCEEQLRNVGATVNTMGTMFNAQGE